MRKVIDGPIKVLEILHNSGITGPGRYVYNFAKHVDRREFSVDVLCPQLGPLADDLRKVGIRVIPFGSDHVWDAFNIFRLCLKLRRERYHILNVHSGQLNAFSKVIGKLIAVPAIIVTEHLSASDHIWIKNKAFLYLHLLCHCLSNAMADKIIAVSDAARHSFIQRQKMAPEKIVTIYGGVDTQELGRKNEYTGEIKKRWGIPEGVPVVGMVARLHAEKGHSTFILAAGEVLRAMPDARFLIVGEGKKRQDIENLIEKTDFKRNFILTGLQKDVDSLIDIMDVLVQPSLPVSESFGLAGVEAMAKGKAVIVSDIECFKEIVENNKNGLVFPVEDYSKLAEKILILLKDEQLRKNIGAAAQDTVRDKFDSRITQKKTMDLYKEVLRGKGFTFA